MKTGCGAIALALVIPTIGLAGSKSTVADVPGKVVIDARERVAPVHDLPFAAGGRLPAGAGVCIQKPPFFFCGAPPRQTSCRWRRVAVRRRVTCYPSTTAIFLWTAHRGCR